MIDNDDMAGGGSVRCCWPNCCDWRPFGFEVPFCWSHARQVTAEYMAASGLGGQVRKVQHGPSLPEVGSVYYIRIDGLVKIGYAKVVANRMRAYPPTAELLAIEPGTKATERERHGWFRQELEHGREWFRESEKLARWIAEVREKHGDPSERAHRYTVPPEKRR